MEDVLTESEDSLVETEAFAFWSSNFLHILYLKTKSLKYSEMWIMPER